MRNKHTRSKYENKYEESIVNTLGKNKNTVKKEKTKRSMSEYNKFIKENSDKVIGPHRLKKLSKLWKQEKKQTSGSTVKSPQIKSRKRSPKNIVDNGKPVRKSNRSLQNKTEEKNQQKSPRQPKSPKPSRSPRTKKSTNLQNKIPKKNKSPAQKSRKKKNDKKKSPVVTGNPKNYKKLRFFNYVDSKNS